MGLELAFGVVSHQAAVFRDIILFRVFQKDAEGGKSPRPGLLLSGPVIFTLQLWHLSNHLNRIHFETALNSFCCDNPSLDVYFNSASAVGSLMLSISAVPGIKFTPG